MAWSEGMIEAARRALKSAKSTQDEKTIAARICGLIGEEEEWPPKEPLPIPSKPEEQA